MESIMKRKKLSHYVGLLANYGLMSFLAGIFLYPTYNLIKRSLVGFDGQGISYDNFRLVLEDVPFSHYLLNSIIIACITILVGLSINSMLAYALARMRWRWATLILGLILSLITIPFEALAVPLLLLTNSFGWLDTLHVQIIPFIADPFSVFLFYQFFLKFPRDLEDAALVDGLGHFRIFLQIISPNSLSVFATAAILKFLFIWDSYLWPVMVTRGPQARPLTVGLQGGLGPLGSAYATLMTIPTIVLFLALQKWFVRSITATGLQG
jgi:multiple sugar transport system permease protein